MGKNASRQAQTATILQTKLHHIYSHASINSTLFCVFWQFQALFPLQYLPGNSIICWKSYKKEDNMSKKTRNGYIDLLRFVAACIIMYFHFEIAPFIRPDGTPGSFPSGGLFVEFFFMLSGYFAISSFYMSDGKLHIGKYMLKKYVRFLPYTFFAVTFTYVWILICSNPSLFEAAKTLCMLPFEALLMRNTGINRVGHNGVLWYLSAMLITMPIILYTARRFPTVFKEYLVWVLPLCFYGYVLSRYGTIRTTHWQISNIRALAGMLLGCNIYFIVHAVENIRFSSRGKTILTVLELGLFGLILLFC